MPEEMTLLLVDDDETTRDLLTLMLGAEGWQVRDAEDGDAAIRIVNGDDALPSVILTDLQMPGLSGSAMATAIRKSIATRGPASTPLLIAMTATEATSTPAGFDDLLVKPFPPEELLRRCKALWSSTTATRDHASHEVVSNALDDGGDPVLAADVFERLRTSMPQQQLQSLYEFALADAEARIQRMEEAAAAKDDARFRSEAHALKGSCGMIGATHVRNLAAHAESAGLETTFQLTESKPSTEFIKGIAQIRHMLERLLPH